MNAKLYANRAPYDTVLHSGAKFHHRATAQGYVSRKPDEPKICTTYSGKFGTGFCVYEPRHDTTNYCWVSYYIFDKE